MPRHRHDHGTSTPLQLEQKHVYEVYDQVAHHFQHSRHRAWPKVKQFLQDLEPGSLVADIGCGNGRYLHINPNIFKLGCDYCAQLVEIAKGRKHEVLVCDNLRLPFRDDAFDAVISIAVVHHFTTKERRVQALRELSRVLRPGGKLLIYVWAMEQKHRKFESQDVLVPWIPPVSKKKKSKDHSPSSVSEDESSTEQDQSSIAAMMNSRSHDPESTTKGPLLRDLPKASRVEESLEDPPCRPPEKDFSRTVPVVQSIFRFKKKTSPATAVSHAAAAGKTGGAKQKGQDSSDAEDSGSETCTIKQPKHTNKSASLKMKFLALLGQKSSSDGSPKAESGTELEKSPKDKAYMYLLQHIMESKSHLLTNRPALEHSMSVPETSWEGFAVREFPQSSQPRFTKHISLDVRDTQKVKDSQGNTSLSESEQAVGDQAEAVKQCREGQGELVSSQCKGKLCCRNQKEVLGDLCTDGASCHNRPHGDNDIKDSTSGNQTQGLNNSDDSAGPTLSITQPGFAQRDSVNGAAYQGEISTLAHGTQEVNGTNCASSNEDSVGNPEPVPASQANNGVHNMTVSVKQSLLGNLGKSHSESDSESWQKVTAQAIETLESEISSSTLPELPKRCLRHKKKLARNGHSGLNNGLARNSRNGQEPAPRSSVSSEEGYSDSDCYCDSPLYIPEHWDSSDVNTDEDFENGEECDGWCTEEHDGNHDNGSLSNGNNDNIPPDCAQNDKALLGGGESCGCENNSNGTKAVPSISAQNDTCMRYYHVFKEGELVSLIQKYVDCLDVVDSCYDHANWCIVAEKVDVWKI